MCMVLGLRRPNRGSKEEMCLVSCYFLPQYGCSLCARATTTIFMSGVKTMSLARCSLHCGGVEGYLACAWCSRQTRFKSSSIPNDTSEHITPSNVARDPSINSEQVGKGGVVKEPESISLSTPTPFCTYGSPEASRFAWIRLFANPKSSCPTLMLF